MKVFEIVDGADPVEVGEVLITDEGLNVTAGPDELDDLVAALEVLDRPGGEPVAPTDPRYAAAVADSIGNASGWRFVVPPEEEVDSDD